MSFGKHSEFALSRAVTYGPRSTISLAVDQQTAISGKTETVQIHAQSKRRLDLEFGPRKALSIDAVLTAWQVHDGPVTGFRARDPSDYSSSGTLSVTPTDQPLIADLPGWTGGSVVALTKTRAIGARAMIRRIRKPVARGFRLAVDGEEITAFTVDFARGLVSFADDPKLLWPDAGTITWGGYFDLPVRFSPELSVETVACDIETAQSVLLFEMFDDDDLNPATPADEERAALGPSDADLAQSETDGTAYIAACESWPL